MADWCNVRGENSICDNGRRGQAHNLTRTLSNADWRGSGTTGACMCAFTFRAADRWWGARRRWVSGRWWMRRRVPTAADRYAAAGTTESGTRHRCRSLLTVSIRLCAFAYVAEARFVAFLGEFFTSDVRFLFFLFILILNTMNRYSEW